MFNNKRTSAEFHSDKAKGQKAEQAFMELIAVMGGTASSLGTVPGMYGNTPRFSRPHLTNEEGFTFSVSPDILFTLANQPKGFASLAQIKVKKLQSNPSKGEFYILLDEKELHRMFVAETYYDVFFVIHVPELAGIDGFNEWMWVNVEDLREQSITLIKRKIRDTPTFLLPLSLFQPLSTIMKRSLNEPANTHAKPKDKSL